MKKPKFYKFTFEKRVVVTRGFSIQEMKVAIQKYGKLLKKEEYRECKKISCDFESCDYSRALGLRRK